jgi:hypothetical protein
MPSRLDPLGQLDSRPIAVSVLPNGDVLLEVGSVSLRLSAEEYEQLKRLLAFGLDSSVDRLIAAISSLSNELQRSNLTWPAR